MQGRLAALSLLQRSSAILKQPFQQSQIPVQLSSALQNSGELSGASGTCSPAGSAWAQLLQGGLRFKSNSAASAGLKVYNPTTPAMRGRVITSRDDLWKGKPYKPLTFGKRSTGGRNNTGTVTAWHRGGGHKRLLRDIDFGLGRVGSEAKVQRIEYDPNRSARIALVKYAGGDTKANYRYRIAPQNVVAGDVMASGSGAPITPGTTMPLESMPPGTQIHNIELHPGKGGQMVRSAGASATILSKGADGFALVRLPSGENRAVLLKCIATIGAVSNPAHHNRKIGRAGSMRWMGRRPVVRGVAMNSVDHPHGGGRGKSKGRISQTPWGIPCKGYRTRKNERTDQYIRLSRHKARAGR